MKKIYSLISLLAFCLASQAQVVISQVYGGGGNGATATYSNDFVELFNRGTAAQSLSGWSIQYASATGTTWARTELPNVMLMPGKYFLIQEAAGTAITLALPTPDLNGSSCNCSFGAPTVTIPTGLIATGLALSGLNGKVILVNNTTLESTANPSGLQIIDKVGYGTTNGSEGTSGTGTALTSITAVIRNSNGCADANNNATDFTIGLPVPRNSVTPANICGPLSTYQNQIAGLKVYISNNNLYITSDNNELKSVSVYNILGKEVVKTSTYSNPINVSELSSGIYIVKVSENGKTNTLKVIIQ